MWFASAGDINDFDGLHVRLGRDDINRRVVASADIAGGILRP
jgi:hypothetical protein